MTMRLRTKCDEFSAVTTARGLSSICLVFLSTLLFSSYLLAQDLANNAHIHSEVTQNGSAEMRSVSNGMFDPAHQPEVYWHDSDWDIDLINRASDEKPYEISIRSSSGSLSIVKLPQEYEQVNSIYRAPRDKAIIVEEDHTSSGAFAIVDLKQGRLIDNVGVAFSIISPDRRFILYQNWYPAEAEYYENTYHLYDTSRTPRQNVCGYRGNDPKHEYLDDGMRGFQVFPQKVGQLLCSGPEDDDDDNMGTNFTWSPDSSKIVFADVKSGVMSLILVTMPVGTSDLPKTSTYPLVGAENVCAGATDAAGEAICDYHVIQSLGWDGDTVTAVFNHRFGTKLNLTMAIPVSRFTPIGK